MSDVYLIGTGQSDFDSFPDEGYRSLLQIAYETACAASGFAVRQDASGPKTVELVAFDLDAESVTILMQLVGAGENRIRPIR